MASVIFTLVQSVVSSVHLLCLVHAAFIHFFPYDLSTKFLFIKISNAKAKLASCKSAARFMYSQ